MSPKYHLRVTAGPNYDISTHRLVQVNTPNAIHIQTPDIDAQVTVQIQNYHGLPTFSPSTSTYFASPPHANDLYSIAFRFTLPATAPEITGADLVFGNDFDKPVRDHLPPGFSTAFRIVRWAIDPGIDGDVYGDTPYLYGPLLSSINTLHINPASSSSSDIHEGGTGAGAALREAQHVPADAGARRKHFLNEKHRAEWNFAAEEVRGLEYACDFFNPYLDFNEFSLKLPGFTLPIMKYWDGQPLRYVLKVKKKDGSLERVLFVVMIALVKEEDLEGERRKWEETEEKKKEGEESEEKKKGEETEQKKKPEEKSGYVDEGVD